MTRFRYLPQILFFFIFVTITLLYAAISYSCSPPRPKVPVDVYLTQPGAPVIVELTDSMVIYAEENATKVFKCIARGKPCPSISWYIKRPFHSRVEELYITSFGHSNGNMGCDEYFRNIDVIPVDTSNPDARQLKGEITCTASNSLGSDSKGFYVTFSEDYKYLKWVLPLIGVCTIAIFILVGLVQYYRERGGIPIEIFNQIVTGEYCSDLYNRNYRPMFESLPIDYRYEIAETNFDDTREVLGEGYTAKVIEVLLRVVNPINGRIMDKKAVMKVPKSKEQRLLEDFVGEIKLWTAITQCDHEHKRYLAEFIGFHIDQSASVTKKVIIFLELYKSDLDSRLRGNIGRERREGVNTPTFIDNITIVEGYPHPRYGDPTQAPVLATDILRISIQVSKALQCLHSLQIVHGDLFSRNLLITRTHHPCIRLTDFGLSKTYETQINPEHASQVYLRPLESFGVEAINPSEAWDVWGYGVLLWEMWSLCDGNVAKPYAAEAALMDGDKLEVIRHKIHRYLTQGGRLNMPTKCPEEIYDIVRECWDPIPALRPTFAQLTMKLERFASDNRVAHLMMHEPPGPQPP